MSDASTRNIRSETIENSLIKRSTRFDEDEDDMLVVSNPSNLKYVKCGTLLSLLLLRF